jgi:hypothetical protein
MNRLDVQTSRLQPVLMMILGAIFIPLALLSMFVGIRDGFSPMPVVMGVVMLATFGGISWIVRRAHGRSVRCFSDEGLERNDGRRFGWAELERVVHQVRPDPANPGQKRLWRTEIWFRNGQSAWLLPLRVGNRREVSDFVDGLPCEHTEKNV